MIYVNIFVRSESYDIAILLRQTYDNNHCLEIRVARNYNVWLTYLNNKYDIFSSLETTKATGAGGICI